MTYVCDNCINDYAIQGFIRDNAVASFCDYCDRTSAEGNIAADLSTLVDFIEHGGLNTTVTGSKANRRSTNAF